MKNMIVGMALVLVAGTWGFADEKETDPKRDKEANFMDAKLRFSQKLLSALATEDYDQMVAQAQNLKLMSLESTWNILQTQDYIQHSADFRRRADNLTKAAKQKNLDAAALAYVQLTLNCIECHKHVRDVNAAAPVVKPEIKSKK
jgi:cytochrome c556